MAVIAAGIFTYEAGGWRQFGYRYIIDVIPAGFVVFAFAYQRFNRWMLAAFAWSLAVNVYGVATWKDLPRARAERLEIALRLGEGGLRLDERVGLRRGGGSPPPRRRRSPARP